jgi:hypothetical protein
MWKQNPLMRKCMDINIVKKISEYIKIDLSEGFNLYDRKRIRFVHVTLNGFYGYYGWKVFPDFYSACMKCLRVQCNLHYGLRVGNDISSYRNRFEFDDPILEA